MSLNKISPKTIRKSYKLFPCINVSIDNYLKGLMLISWLIKIFLQTHPPINIKTIFNKSINSLNLATKRKNMLNSTFTRKTTGIKRSNNLKPFNNKINILKIKSINSNQGSGKNNSKLTDLNIIHYKNNWLWKS